MLEIKPLATPETVNVPGGVFTLTHAMQTLHINARFSDRAVELRAMKGFLDKDGNFQDFGDHAVSILDAQGLADMLADTTGGKPAGVFRTTDILPAIAKRQATIQAAADAAKAAADAQAKAQAPKAP